MGQSNSQSLRNKVQELAEEMLGQGTIQLMS
jgi:hypothetical protein